MLVHRARADVLCSAVALMGYQQDMTAVAVSYWWLQCKFSRCCLLAQAGLVFAELVESDALYSVCAFCCCDKFSRADMRSGCVHQIDLRFVFVMSQQMLQSWKSIHPGKIAIRCRPLRTPWYAAEAPGLAKRVSWQTCRFDFHPWGAGGKDRREPVTCGKEENTRPNARPLSQV